jgi:Ser/Thr protein kinase RdoA (MazF antagonist)
VSATATSTAVFPPRRGGRHRDLLREKDCGGPGWRAYDIAVFRWTEAYYEENEKQWSPFLERYRQERPLSEIDLQAVPLFVAPRHLWLMGGEVADAAYQGFSSVGDRYFDKALRFLREWESRTPDA